MPRIAFSPTIRIPPQVFPQRVNVARAVQTLEEGAGGRLVTPPDRAPIVYANVPVSIQNAGSKEETVQGRLIAVTNHEVFCGVSLDVINGDFFLPIGTSRVLIVQTVQNVSGLNALWLFGCIEYLVSAQN